MSVFIKIQDRNAGSPGTCHGVCRTAGRTIIIGNYGRGPVHEVIVAEAVYGLCEINREKIRGARLVANPGCYPTCSILTVYPLVNGAVEAVVRMALAAVLTGWILGGGLMGAGGIWVSTGFAWAVSAASVYLRYRRGRWRAKSLVDRR